MVWAISSSDPIALFGQPSWPDNSSNAVKTSDSYHSLLEPWRWSNCVPPKRWHTAEVLQGVINHNTVVSVVGVLLQCLWSWNYKDILINVMYRIIFILLKLSLRVQKDDFLCFKTVELSSEVITTSVWIQGMSVCCRKSCKWTRKTAIFLLTHSLAKASGYLHESTLVCLANGCNGDVASSVIRHITISHVWDVRGFVWHSITFYDISKFMELLHYRMHIISGC